MNRTGAKTEKGEIDEGKKKLNKIHMEQIKQGNIEKNAMTRAKDTQAKGRKE